jgi:type II secretory pathway component PulK
MHPLSPRRRDALAARRARLAARRGEAGVSIVLVFLVLLVLAAVLTELRYNASVELDRAVSYTNTERMRRLADAAEQQAQAALIMDSEAAKAADENVGGGPLMPGAPGEPPQSDEDQAGGDADNAQKEADIAATTAETDSQLDDWADSAALSPALGEDWSLCTEIEDEDSKINLLGLWTGDETARQEWSDIVRDLLDKAFEGSSRDISFSDATDIIDRLNDWVRGDRGGFDPVPKPPLKKTNEQDQAADKGGTLDTSVMDTSESNWPLTLGELLMMPKVLPEHLSGFVEDDHYYPGLERYLTVFSQLELKPKPKLPEDEFGDSPFGKSNPPGGGNQAGGSGGGGGKGSGSGQAGGGPTGGGQAGGGNQNGDEPGADGNGGTGDEDKPGWEEEGFEPTPTNDGLVNVNTAPLAVLRAIAPQDIPTSFIEKVVEFRNRIAEIKKERQLGGIGSLFDTAQGGTADDKAGADDAPSTGFGKDEEEDITRFVFKSPQEVMDKVSKEFGYELNLDPGVETKFLSRLTTTSQVFTIKVLVYSLAQNPRTARMEFGRRSTWRAVLWRMLGDTVPHAVTLMPLEPYRDARRLKDYPGDLQQLASDQNQALNNLAPGQ